MISRAGSNVSSSNLRRSKSSTSVKDRRKHPLPSEPLDPETSRLHALIAAHKAMDRSHGSDIQVHIHTGNMSIQRSSTQRTAQNVHFSPGPEAQRKSLSQPATASPSKPRPCIAEHVKIGNYSYEDSLLSSDLGGMGENYGAQPSSYRRLGRARSMLMTGRRSRQFLNGATSETSFSQAPTLRNAVSSMSLRESNLRLRFKRSLSILRPTNRNATAPSQLQLEHTNRPESILLARQQFLEGVSSPQVQRKVSRIFQSRSKREHKAFRQTLRPDLPKDYMALNGASLDPPASSVRKKDSISSLLRSRFMKSFSKRGNNMDTLPPQQLSATRDYSGTHVIGSNAEAGFDSYHEADVGSQRRSSLYIPSNTHPESCEDVESLAQKLRASASFESLRSNSRSRVTSWTNSTIANSTRGAVSENNRLSIIKEDGGPHHPSCSAGRHISGVSAFQQPMPGYGSNEIDSQRVYSALMKRIDQEQAEMDKTQMSLAKIHEDEEHNRINYDEFPHSTIRAVDSPTSSALPPDGLNDINDHQNHPSPVEEKSLSEAESPRFNAKCSKNQTRPTEVQPSFFPFSGDDKPQNPSPFRKILLERHRQRDQMLHDDVADDDASVIIRRKGDSLSCSKFGQSSESIYSRNTDGGTNTEYISPIGSTDQFMPNPLHGYQDTGMATIIYSNYREPNARIPTALSATASEKTSWRGWVENQMANFTRHESKASNHVRENADIESHRPSPVQVNVGEQDEIIASGESTVISDGIVQPAARSTHAENASKFWRPLNDSIPIKGQESHHTASEPSTMDTTPKARRKQSSIATRRNVSEHSQLTRMHELKTSTLRKISSNNITKILKTQKSQSALSSQSKTGKENNPGSATITTPVSTPGRLQLQMRSGNSIGRPGQRMNGSGCEKSGSKVVATTGSVTTVHESPSDRFKNILSARLSRPFDMDIPESNRPFDSMYLGKRTPGFAEAMRGDRLSIAPKAHQTRLHKSYGGLGPPPIFGIDGGHMIDETEATALPAIPDTNNSGSRSTSLTHIAINGRRMVSNFLKSHKKDGGQDVPDANSLGSPAFL